MRSLWQHSEMRRFTPSRLVSIFFLLSAGISNLAFANMLHVAQAGAAETSCATRLVQKKIFSSSEEFLNRVESATAVRFAWQKPEAGKIDLIDLAWWISFMSKNERQALLDQVKPELLRRKKDPGYGHVEFRHELALLALEDAESWMKWVDELLKIGKPETELITVGSFVGSLPENLKNQIKEKIRRQWPDLNKHKRQGNKVSSRRSADILISYLVPIRDFFNGEDPWVAYERYLSAIQAITGDTTFPPADVIKFVHDLQTSLRSHLKGDEALMAYGSFFNGKAHKQSDVDYSLPSGSDIQPHGLSHMTQYSLGRNMLFSQANTLASNSSGYEMDVLFPLQKNSLALLIRRNSITFYLSPYFVPFQSYAEKETAEPEKIFVILQ